MTHELRHALRLLWRAPGFTALAAGTLALGIAASTAIFSLADAVVLAPLPYADAASRVMIWNRWRGFDKTWVNPAEIRAYGERSPSLAAVASWSIDRQNLTGDGEAARVGVARISASGFDVLGARPLSAAASHPQRTAPAGRTWRCWATRSGRAASAATRASSAGGSSSTACRTRSSASCPRASRCRPTSPRTPPSRPRSSSRARRTRTT